MQMKMTDKSSPPIICFISLISTFFSDLSSVIRDCVLYNYLYPLFCLVRPINLSCSLYSLQSSATDGLTFNIPRYQPACSPFIQTETERWSVVSSLVYITMVTGGSCASTSSQIIGLFIIPIQRIASSADS